MVDKRGRQEGSFKRMTSWQDDDDVGSSYGRNPRSQTGGQWSGRSKSSPPTWGQGGSGDKAGAAGGSKGSYWSPGGTSEGSPPISRKSAAKPPAVAKAGQFQRRYSRARLIRVLRHGPSKAQ